MGKKLIYLFLCFTCCGSSRLTAMESEVCPTSSGGNEPKELAETEICPWCQTSYGADLPSYGCSHSEHALCLYENLTVQGKLNKLVDLIACPSDGLITYTCYICNKKQTLDINARHCLYLNCLAQLTENEPLLEEHLLELPLHLARSTIQKLSPEARIKEFIRLRPKGLGWRFLSALPADSWNAYLAALPQDVRSEFEKGKPSELKFIELEDAQRILTFKKLPTTTQRAIILTCWSELLPVERRFYPFTLLDATGATLGEQAGLFANIVANHALAPREAAGLLNTILDHSDTLLPLDEIIFFFIPQLDREGTDYCTEVAFKHLSLGNQISLLVKIRKRLTDIEQETKLLGILLSTMKKNIQFYQLSSAISDLSPECASTWTAVVINHLGSMEGGARFLLDVWNVLEPKARRSLAHKVFTKKWHPASKLDHTTLLLEKFPINYAYEIIKALCKQSSSTAAVAGLLETVYAGLNQQRRLEILSCICTNKSLNPTPRQLSRLLSPLPPDTVIGCLPLVFEKLPSVDEQGELLMHLKWKIVSKKHTRSLKNLKTSPGL
ncbi:MAG: hypothetical protein M1549_03165 [Candidatus Dependentiae bacterium]|nr:hypothetical protein [Candidatus Dependentiae bacterium]